jgi:PhnB protein
MRRKGDATMQVQPYVIFEGRCEEALEFYTRAIGAKAVPPGFENKVLHAAFQVGDSTILASDGRGTGAGPKFEGFALSLTVANDAEAKRLHAALSDGGQVIQPLIKTFFASSFGMVADRFGVTWMVYVAP